MRIGFFDSGMGGISVARSVIRFLPQYTYVYFADDLHMPYGNKSPQVLFDLTTKALRTLFDREQCALVILACNTATTVLPRIQQEWLPNTFPERKALGVIRPTVEYMTERHGVPAVYVLATYRTVKSQAYDHELVKIGKTCDFHEIACPKLAQAIEMSDYSGKDQHIYNLCNEYLTPVPDTYPVTIYTGCTHYAFAAKHIRKLRPLATVINQGYIVKTKLYSYLRDHHDVEKQLTKTSKSTIQLFCSSENLSYLYKLEKLLS